MRGVITASLLEKAQNQDKFAIDEIIELAKKQCIPSLYKYASRNVLVDGDDLVPIFLTNVYQQIPYVKIDVGDPGVYLMQQAMHITLTSVTKSIRSGIEQVCMDCGAVQRPHKARNTYICPHQNDTCTVDTHIYQESNTKSRQCVPARIIGSNGQVKCRCAKKLNKTYYCQRDYGQFLQNLINECESNKPMIITQMIKAGVCNPEKEFAYGITLNKVHGFHNKYLPDSFQQQRGILTQVTVDKVDNRLQCTKCGSYNTTTRMTNQNDEVSDGNSAPMSLTEDCASIEDHYDCVESAITDDMIEEYVDMLRGREQQVMALLFDGNAMCDIAKILGIKPVCVTRYKQKAIPKAVKFFYHILKEILTPEMMNQLYEKYPELEQCQM